MFVRLCPGDHHDRPNGKARVTLSTRCMASICTRPVVNRKTMLFPFFLNRATATNKREPPPWQLHPSR
jgi:hypothetical protein